MIESKGRAPSYLHRIRSLLPSFLIIGGGSLPIGKARVLSPEGEYLGDTTMPAAIVRFRGG